jgi:hypothetical protein
MLTTNPRYNTDGRPLSNYADAFIKHARVSRNDFLLKSLCGQVLVFYNDELYQIARLNDLARTCQSLFNRNDLAIAFPAELWQYFINSTVKPSTADLVIDLYQTQKHAWENVYQVEEFKQFATDLLNRQPDSLATIAGLDDDDEYLSVIARAIKALYKNEADFFSDCAGYMIRYFPQSIGNGKVFRVVTAPDDTYYIYSIDQDD